MAKPCPRPGCGRPVEDHSLCCPACWRLIPEAIRRDLQSPTVRQLPGLYGAALAAATRALTGTVILSAAPKHTGKAHHRRRAVRSRSDRMRASR